MKSAPRRRLTYRGVLQSIHHYLIFFLLTAFITTCCMMLFITVLTHTLEIELNETNMEIAAKITFANVILLSLLLASLDALRRKLTLKRPVRTITEAAEKIMEGDFSVRIAPLHGAYDEVSFNRIVDCFNQMAEELSATETLRTDFIADVSHELKTPLAVMQNYATMLRQPDLPEEKRLEYSKAITDACRTLANLVTNILKLNKLERQQLTPAAEIYDLTEQVCECLLGFEETWEEKELEIETELADGLSVKSDPEMLTLVWNNLFSNAVKFTERGGKITVRTYAEADTAVVQISDTGCGISAEVGARIFDKFYQGDTSHATQGNGLGLALVKRVVDITGSDISVESEIGKGSTFTVKLRRYIQ